MKFGPVRVEDAVGSILAHKLVDQDGKKILGKGLFLSEEHVATLISHGLKEVIVASLASEDLHENQAAERIAQAILGNGVRLAATSSGRASLLSTVNGPLRVNVPALQHLNNIDEGITIVTLREHTLVEDSTLVGLVKVIPFGIKEARVIDVEAVTQNTSPILMVNPLKSCTGVLIISGPDAARDDLINAFEHPIRTRLENLNSHLECVDYVAHTRDSVAEAIRRHADKDLILIASISAIIDRDDIVPSALEAASGSITHFGVPVDPGSLMMLGYLGEIPVIGMPGCVRSLKTNIIDWVLPRLIAGEHLTRADIVVMGHGGLLEDISERPSPRPKSEQSERSSTAKEVY
jgi:molybdenum cofactor cytidylyltransferase